LIKMLPTKNIPPSFVISTFPAHHGFSGFGFYRRHRSSGAQTKGTDLIYDLLVMPHALGLVKYCTGDDW